ncbi:unnamed protein product, partial [Effrenium voratum]
AGGFVGAVGPCQRIDGWGGGPKIRIDLWCERDKHIAANFGEEKGLNLSRALGDFHYKSR